jgi:tight adherence protein B
MPFEIDAQYLFYAFAAGAAVLVAEAVYLLFHSSSSYRNRINRRLALLDDNVTRDTVLVQLRRERGLNSDGEFRLPIEALNRLIMQSGLAIGCTKLIMFCAFGALVIFAVTMNWRSNFGEATIASIAGGVFLPYLVLRMLRGRRLKKFGLQFPEAIDVIVRSLRAGHPVPVAVSMVGREFPDPIGSEFGIVTDEITYGADLETAMRRTRKGTRTPPTIAAIAAWPKWPRQFITAAKIIRAPKTQNRISLVAPMAMPDCMISRLSASTGSRKSPSLLRPRSRRSCTSTDSRLPLSSSKASRRLMRLR